MSNNLARLLFVGSSLFIGFVNTILTELKIKAHTKYASVFVSSQLKIEFCKGNRSFICLRFSEYFCLSVF